MLLGPFLLLIGNIGLSSFFLTNWQPVPWLYVTYFLKIKTCLFVLLLFSTFIYLSILTWLTLSFLLDNSDQYHSSKRQFSCMNPCSKSSKHIFFFVILYYLVSSSQGFSVSDDSIIVILVTCAQYLWFNFKFSHTNPKHSIKNNYI